MTKKKAIILGAAIVAVLVTVLVVVLLVPKGGSKKDDAPATFDEGIDLKVSVDGDKLHQAEVVTDKDGNISNNSYGTLMEYYPANIRDIHIENKQGSFDVISETPEGQATVYTIKGFEDFDLQPGNPDVIASAAAKLKFTQVATLDKAKGDEEFGFDEPRSTVTVTYEDDTKAKIIVGDDAPQGAGTYIRFGTGDAVYLVSTDTAAVFDYGVNDLISLTVNKPADSVENNEVSEITLSGSGFDQSITLVPNTDANYSASFRMTAPIERQASEKESSVIAGCVRGLNADSVKLVNPSDDQLKTLGLNPPHAKISAAYPDGQIELLSSKPDSDGNVFLMVGGGKVVYVIPAAKVAWSKTGYEALCSEYALYPKMTALSAVEVKADGKTYQFTVDSKEVNTTDESGIEITRTETNVALGGKSQDLGVFTAFYNKLALIELADAKSDNGSGKQVLSADYTFADGETASVEFIDAGGDTYIAKVNGKAVGHASKANVAAAVSALGDFKA